jgi:hypothetical protein
MEIMNKEMKGEMNMLGSDFSWSNWYYFLFKKFMNYAEEN